MLATDRSNGRHAQAAPHPLAHDRFAPVTCAACGRAVPRKSRTQQFCSVRCRKRGATNGSKSKNKSLCGLPIQKPGTPPYEKLNKIKGDLRGVFGPRCAIADEIVDAHEWREVTSSDGVLYQVATLRRRALQELSP